MKLPATALALLAAMLTGTAHGNSCCESPSWIFDRSTFTHDPQTGARVAQYWRTPPVEPLPDTRLITSGYRRTRTVLRGTQGSVDAFDRVENWGNGRGGIDAEWERFHRAWQGSVISGGRHQSQWQPQVHPGFGYGPGYGPGGYQNFPPQQVVPHGYGPQPGVGTYHGFAPGGHGAPHGSRPHDRRHESRGPRE